MPKTGIWTEFLTITQLESVELVWFIDYLFKRLDFKQLQQKPENDWIVKLKRKSVDQKLYFPFVVRLKYEVQFRDLMRKQLLVWLYRGVCGLSVSWLDHKYGCSTCGYFLIWDFCGKRLKYRWQVGMQTRFAE